MSIERDMRERSIRRFGVRTPLVVPSFSSRGFTDVGEFFPHMKADLYGVCLLSTFDIATGRIPADYANVADVVVLDSGVYETTEAMVAADQHHQAAIKGRWSRPDYRSFLKTIGPEVNAVVVSFDTYGSVAEQVTMALDDFAAAPAAATDLLLKPRHPDLLLDVGTISSDLGALSPFDVVGVTERELGDSLVTRCKGILALRAGLRAVQLDSPIHVFGTITPGAMLAYFCCGADIFDGLNWLRYDYGRAGLACISEPWYEDPLWEEPDSLRHVATWRRNLSRLHRIQEAMRAVANGAPVLRLAEPLAADGAFHAAIRAAKTAGADISAL